MTGAQKRSSPTLLADSEKVEYTRKATGKNKRRFAGRTPAFLVYSKTQYDIGDGSDYQPRNNRSLDFDM